jgi:hypothetical protein
MIADRAFKIAHLKPQDSPIVNGYAVPALQLYGIVEVSHRTVQVSTSLFRAGATAQGRPNSWIDSYNIVEIANRSRAVSVFQAGIPTVVVGGKVKAIHDQIFVG